MTALLLQLRADLAALEMRWALAKLAYKYNFNPAQPRVPAGVPGLLFQTARALGWSGRRAARSESFSNMRKRAPSRSCDGKALSILPYPSSVSITFLRKTGWWTVLPSPIELGRSQAGCNSEIRAFLFVPVKPWWRH